MPTAIFRFYEELNDLLPRHRRKVDFRAAFQDKRSVKDMIESLGVPHTEVDLILVNGQSVDFGYILEDNDRVSVYPAFESLDIQGVTRLRDRPLRNTRFLVDTNMGDIMRLMRLLGFDVLCHAGMTSRQMIDVSNREHRIILTKSKSLLKFKDVTHGVYIRPGTPVEQVKGILDRLDIKDQAKPYSRCLLCNGTLKGVAKEAIMDRIPPVSRRHCEGFSVCTSCNQLYWNGSHMVRMKKKVDEILK